MTKTVEEKDQKMTGELTDDALTIKDENGRQAAKNQESHNTYVMNGRHTSRNQEGHTTYVKKIMKNLIIVADLLYKYQSTLIVKTSEKSIHIFFFVAKKCNGELSFL